MLNKKSLFIGITIAFFITVFDLISKIYIFSLIEKTNQNQIVITSFFSLVQVLNKGISFGMFNGIKNSQVIFSLLQTFIAIILTFWLLKTNNLYISIALGLIIGGAFGNIIDRIINGAVADFLDFHINSYHWPAFNLADSSVFIGVTMLIFEEIFNKKK